LLLRRFLTDGTPCLINNKGLWRDQILEDASAFLEVGMSAREEALLNFGEPDLALKSQKLIRLPGGLV